MKKIQVKMSPARQLAEDLDRMTVPTPSTVLGKLKRTTHHSHHPLQPPQLALAEGLFSQGVVVTAKCFSFFSSCLVHLIQAFSAWQLGLIWKKGFGHLDFLLNNKAFGHL